MSGSQQHVVQVAGFQAGPSQHQHVQVAQPDPLSRALDQALRLGVVTSKQLQQRSSPRVHGHLPPLAVNGRAQRVYSC